MKSLHIASILAVSAATAFACNDDEDRNGLDNSAGTTSSEAGSPNTSGSAGQDSNTGGAGGGAAGADMGGSAGAMAGGAAGEAGEAGSAGEGGEAGTGGAGTDPEPFELIGKYDDNFRGSFEITADAWSASAIAAYDNAQNVVYTQFPANALYNPNKFAKTVYTEPTGGGSFYFCMIVYSADTLAAAQASTATTDDSNPETGGCGQYPWTKATPK